MSGPGLVRMAVGNSVRSMSRTALTALALVIGAFTLTLTTSVGNGINTYIDNTVASIGGASTLTVTKTPDEGDGPRKYTGATLQDDTQDAGPPSSVEAVTASDLRAIRGVDGVVSAEPVLSVSPDYIRYDGGQRFQLQVQGYVEGTTLQLLAGEQPDPESTTRQIVLPESYLDPLDLDDADDAVDESVTLAVTDADGKQTTVTAKVVGVAEATLANSGTASVNEALASTLYDRQSVGLSTADKERYASVTVAFDSAATGDEVAALKADLADEGYDAETVEDQIGDFKTVIDAVLLVLNGFAVLALVAAGIGIVNTLLMSVKERTREIGLMKAMGMSSGSVFAMFSLEAVLIGLLGSAVGALLAGAVGTVLNGALSGGLLSGLPGLTLFVFAPPTVIGIILGVMAIAFVAGTVPALRAARQDPIDSLRYE